MFKLKDIDSKWFFTELPLPLKILTVYVKGDLIVLLPLLLGILLTGLFSVRFMIAMLGAYVLIRYAGEMMYWFSHQFNERKYRPYDIGFKKLDNNAVYILYQTQSTAGAVLGVGLLIYALYFMK